nr:MAG TPA: Dynein light chain type 1 [Bacteriophage sp.]
MGRLIDADELSDFFFSETSGTEEIIHDLMQKHELNYDNGVNEDAVMDFAIDLLKGAQNVIDTQPTGYDPDKVVQQLEKEFKKYYGENWNKAPYLVKAIEIVKAGGTDES